MDTLHNRDAYPYDATAEALQQPEVRRRLLAIKVGIRAVEPAALRGLFESRRAEVHVFRGSLATQCRTLVRLAELLEGGAHNDPSPEIPGLLHGLLEEFDEHSLALRTVRRSSVWSERELLGLLETQLAAAEALFPARQPRHWPEPLSQDEIDDAFRRRINRWESK